MFWVFAVLTLNASTSVAQNLPTWWTPEPPLQPAPTNNFVRASTAQQILELGERLAPNSTLLIEPGIYKLDRPLVLRKKQGITIRSINGDPTSVTLQGKGWDVGTERDDIIHVADCDGVFIHGVTFAEARSYGIKVQAEDGPRNIHIMNCRFRNIGVRAIKGSAGNDPTIRAVNGSIRYCDFENTKTPPADWLFNGDYISAIDMMALERWTIDHNTFRNIKGRNGGGRAAVFIWVRSRNVRVYSNLIINCDRGISFGNPGQSTANKPGEQLTYVANSTIQNNMITGGADCGIELWHVDGIKVLHNSTWRPERNFNRGIRIGAGATNTLVQNNLIHGGIQIEGGSAQVTNNLAKHLDRYFTNPETGDLSLTSTATEAIDAAIPLDQALLDIRARNRVGKPDLGAWELNAPSSAYWVKPMSEVHARFKGARGACAQIGDSITFSGAYWSPLASKPTAMTPSVEASYELLKNYLKPESFNQKGPDFGNKGSMTIKWARENISTWLKNLNPEVAVIMFGSNDVGQIDVAQYSKLTREVIDACLANGTIPILTTPPPQTARLAKTLQFAAALREIALECRIPLIDYSQQILLRRPYDWDGSAPAFKNIPGDTYEVPALISRDGVHPSNPRAHANDFSPTSLSNNGYTLRNYLTLLTYAEVVREILDR
jgi:hypothetical protein